MKYIMVTFIVDMSLMSCYNLLYNKTAVPHKHFNTALFFRCAVHVAPQSAATESDCQH